MIIYFLFLHSWWFYVHVVLHTLQPLHFCMAFSHIFCIESYLLMFLFFVFSLFVIVQENHVLGILPLSISFMFRSFNTTLFRMESHYQVYFYPCLFQAMLFLDRYAYVILKHTQCTYTSGCCALQFLCQQSYLNSITLVDGLTTTIKGQIVPTSSLSSSICFRNTQFSHQSDVYQQITHSVIVQ